MEKHISFITQKPEYGNLLLSGADSYVNLENKVFAKNFEVRNDILTNNLNVKSNLNIKSNLNMVDGSKLRFKKNGIQYAELSIIEGDDEESGSNDKVKTLVIQSNYNNRRIFTKNKGVFYSITY